MSYLRVGDRPIEIEIFPVNAHLWAARLPGGMFYCHGETPELALERAYRNLTTWRLNKYKPYEGQDLDSEYARARLVLNRSSRKIKDLVRVVSLIRENPPHSLVYVGRKVPHSLQTVYAMPSLEGDENGRRVYGLRNREDITQVVARLLEIPKYEPTGIGAIIHRNDGNETRYRVVGIKDKK